MRYEAKSKVIDAIQLPDWVEINTGETVITGRKGDYLVLDGGTLRIMPETEFLANYQPIKPPPLVSSPVWRGPNTLTCGTTYEGQI